MALARALVKRPKLLLLDEPLGALDRKLREHTQFELINIQEQLGVTFVVVTHDQEEAMTLSSRIGVMNHGQIVQVGTPHRHLRIPGHPFRCRLHRLGQHVRGQADRGRARLRAHPQSRSSAASIYVNHGISSAPDATVWVAVRPERSNQQPSTPASGASASGERGKMSCSGVVKEIAYMGDMSIYLVQLESGKTIRVTIPNVARHAEDRITWDETVVFVTGTRPESPSC